LPGRFQVVPGDPEWILDVAHNPDAARSLAASLVARPCRGRTLAVCGILADKDVEGIAAALKSVIERWFAVGLDSPRGLPPAKLARRLEAGGADAVAVAADVASGLAAATHESRPRDRIVVFGSFLAVGPALDVLGAAA
jgi:dihydrofolate synthase/folylpolyglutamate synthase